MSGRAVGSEGGSTMKMKHQMVSEYSIYIIIP